MTLYELTQEYAMLLEYAEDPDIDPEAIEDTMEGLTGEIEDKADGYAKVIRNMEADAAALKAEIDRFAARKRRIEESIDRMKDRLKNAMIYMERPKIKTALFSFSVQKNPPKAVIDILDKDIPDRWLIPQAPKLDRKGLADALKEEDPEALGIAHLEQSESLRIK